MQSKLVLAVDKVGDAWEVTHVATITTCDSRHRVKVPACVPGRQYIPDGLSLIEVPAASAKPKPVEWAGAKKSLAAHMQALFEAGFEMPEPLHDPVPPCQF